MVTVAVQAAAGVTAIISIDQSANLGPTTVTAITIGVVLLLAYGNLRGVREAGKDFAFATYFFVVTTGLDVVVGVIRAPAGSSRIKRSRHTRGAI